MNRAKAIFVTMCALGLFDAYSLYAQDSQRSAPVAVQGKVVSANTGGMKLSTAGGDVSVKIGDSTKLVAESPIKISDVKSGLYVGVTAQKQRDGSFKASALHVFAEDERGLSEGHRPSSSTPNSTMTNANVERVEDVLVEDVKGSMLTLHYKGGEIEVFVPPTASIVKRIPGALAMLKTAAVVRVVGTRNSDGTINAASITIRASEN